MFAVYQDLLVRTVALLSCLELLLCLGFFVVDARHRRFARMQEAANQPTLDPFFTWINMLERQSDRRSGMRYEGAERRAKAPRPQLAVK